MTVLGGHSRMQCDMVVKTGTPWLSARCIRPTAWRKPEPNKKQCLFDANKYNLPGNTPLKFTPAFLRKSLQKNLNFVSSAGPSPIRAASWAGGTKMCVWKICIVLVKTTWKREACQKPQLEIPNFSTSLQISTKLKMSKKQVRWWKFFTMKKQVREEMWCGVFRQVCIKRSSVSVWCSDERKTLRL